MRPDNVSACCKPGTNTPEMTIKIAQQGFNIEFDKQPDR